MHAARWSLVILTGTALAFACSKEEKKEDEAKAAAAEKGDGDKPAPSEAPTGAELAEVSPGAGMPNMPKLPGAQTLGMLMGGDAEPAEEAGAKGLFSGKFEMDKVFGDSGGEAKTAAAKKAPAPVAAAGGDCAKLAQHVIGLLGEEMSDMPAEAVGQMQKELVRMCNEDGWSADGKACILAATSMDALDGCEDLLGYGGKKDATKPAPAAPKMGTPNDPRCPKVADALMNVMLAEIPADQRAQVEPFMGQVKQQILDECKKGSWPDAFMECALTAKNQNDIQTCAAKLGGM